MTGRGSRVGDNQFRRILGIEFFGGSAREAVSRMRNGGLLVVPAAPALRDLATNRDYRDALLHADLAITDSAYMILVWNQIENDSFPRLSGLEYLRALLLETEVREPGRTMWIMASPRSAELNLAWLKEQGVNVPADAVYIAPMYDRTINDPVLLDRITHLRPRHVVLTIGGGVQERLGLYLKRNLPFLPGIHCIGAAIAFLSGDQVRIPVWVDRCYMGWLYRCVSEPKRYVPRYWAARKLAGLMLQYRGELPPLLERRRR